MGRGSDVHNRCRIKRRKLSDFRLSCRQFPKHTPAAFQLLRTGETVPSLCRSLPTQRPVLTDRPESPCSRSCLWQLCVWAPQGAPRLQGSLVCQPMHSCHPPV